MSTTSAAASHAHLAQAPALATLDALKTSELLTHLPSILNSLHSQLLLQPPPSLSHPSPTPSHRSPHSLYLRLESKALTWLRTTPPPPPSPSPSPSTPTPPFPEPFIALHLLSTLIAHSTPPSLHSGQAKVWSTALRGFLSHPLPLSLRLLALECQVDLLRRARMRELLIPTLTELLQLMGEGGLVEDDGKIEGRVGMRRVLRMVEEVLVEFGGSVRGEDRAVLRAALLRLLESGDDEMVASVTSSLTVLHLALSSSSVSQRQRQQLQQRLQGEAQDTAEEAEERKRQRPSELAVSLSPYHLLCLQVLHSMRDCINPIRMSFALPSLPSTSMHLPELSPLPSSLLPFDHLRRYRRLTTLLLSLMTPTTSTSSSSSHTPTEVLFPLPLLLHTVCATLTMDAATAKDASATVLILPDLYRSALTLLHEVVRVDMGWQVLGQADEVAALLVDVHRRCSEGVSMHGLLPLVYDVLASFLLLPLSPTVLASICRPLLPTVLEHVKQPVVARQRLRQQSAHQRMSAQLLGPQQRRSASPTVSLAPDPLSPMQPQSDDIAASALSALHRMLFGLSFCAPAVRKPLRRQIDGALLVLALALPSIDDAPVPLRCGVYSCMLQAVLAGGEAGVGGKPSALLVYALALFVDGAKEGEHEDLRAVCQQAVLACEWLRAERTGAVGGKRRRQVDVVTEAKAAESAAQGNHLMDGVDAFHAAAGVPTQPSPFPAQSMLHSSVAAVHRSGWGAVHEAQVGEKRSQMESEEVRVEVEHKDEAVREAVEMEDEDEADVEDELAEAEEGDEVEQVGAERSGTPRTDEERKDAAGMGEASGNVADVEVGGGSSAWAGGEEDEEEDEDVPLDLDAAPDVE